MRLRVSKLALLLVVALLVIAQSFAAVPVSHVQAQDGAAWYLAFQAERGTVVAFNPDGQMNDLLADITENAVLTGWRLSPERLLLLVTQGEQSVLYAVTPESAQALTSTDEWPDLALASALTLSGDYAVVAVGRVPGSVPHILVNLAAGTVEALTGEVLYVPGDNRVRFAAEGTLLRYWSRETRESETWSLIERTLADGSERVAQEYVNSFPSLTPDSTGAHWLVSGRVEGEDLSRVTLLNIDGTQEVVSEVSVAENNDAVLRTIWANDLMLSYRIMCETDCEVTLAAPDGSVTYTYTVPTLAGGMIQPRRYYDDGRVLVSAGSAMWVYAPDGASEPLMLGYTTMLPRVIVSGSSSQIPFNDHLLLAFDDTNPTQVMLWNLDTVELMATQPVENYRSIAILIGTDAMVFYIQTEDEITLYCTAEGMTELPMEDRLYYSWPLADGVVAAAQTRDTDARDTGLYAYNVASGDFTALVPGGQLLAVQQLP